MKRFLILAVFTILGFTSLNAQSNIEINKDNKSVVNPLLFNDIETTIKKETAAKKKDILNAKINSKLQGKVDLFFVADKSIIC